MPNGSLRSSRRDTKPAPRPPSPVAIFVGGVDGPAVRDGNVRRVSVVETGAQGVHGSDDGERAAFDRGCGPALAGCVGRSERQVPEESPVISAPRVTAFELLDAVSLYADAAVRLEDAVRANVSTQPAMDVLLETYREVLRLAYALADAA
jgi:hypothetical protein